MPRRIEVPSTDALFGGPASSPPPALPPAAPPPPATPRRPARRGRPRSADAAPGEGILRRLDELEAGLGELPVDRLIALRERAERLLAAPAVGAAELLGLLELAEG